MHKQNSHRRVETITISWENVEVIMGERGEEIYYTYSKPLTTELYCYTTTLISQHRYYTTMRHPFMAKGPSK